MAKSNRENKNLADEPDVESNIVNVGFNQNYKAFIVIVLMLIGAVYYFYFYTPNKKEIEAENRKSIQQEVEVIKDNLEPIPEYDIIIPKRENSFLPPLPPLPEPKSIPEIKRKEEEKKVNVIKQKEKMTSPKSSIPILPKRSVGSTLTSFSTSLSPALGGNYPKDRRSTQMLVMSSDGGEKMDNATSSNTLAQQEKTTKVGDSGLMIAQGKIIDAILETAINSDFSGVLRAVTSSDVYAEAGNTVLIPKGSRLIGSYAFDSNVSKARVNISWNRVILPHGIDIAISSPGTDQLGRAGVSGIIDNKIASSFFSSILLTGVSVSAAITAQKASSLINVLNLMNIARSIAVTELDISPLRDVLKVKESVKNNKLKLGPRFVDRVQNAADEQEVLDIIKEGIRSNLPEVDISRLTIEDVRALLRQMKRSKPAYENSIEKSINDFSKDMRDIVERSVNKKPTIYVDQGTALKVFVNHDIIFPKQAISYR